MDARYHAGRHGPYGEPSPWLSGHLGAADRRPRRRRSRSEDSGDLPFAAGDSAEMLFVGVSGRRQERVPFDATGGVDEGWTSVGTAGR
jgi:hypothetical protein